MHTTSDGVLSNLVDFLFEELKTARGRAPTIEDEVTMQLLLRQSARRTRRLARLADALSKLDAQTPAS
jgi:hypothetical protein